MNSEDFQFRSDISVVGKVLKIFSRFRPPLGTSFTSPSQRNSEPPLDSNYRQSRANTTRIMRLGSSCLPPNCCKALSPRLVLARTDNRRRLLADSSTGQDALLIRSNRRVALMCDQTSLFFGIAPRFSGWPADATQR